MQAAYFSCIIIKIKIYCCAKSAYLRCAIQILINNCLLGTEIGKLKWPKNTKLCALSNEMSLTNPIQVFVRKVFLTFLALSIAYIFLTNRPGINIFAAKLKHCSVGQQAKPTKNGKINGLMDKLFQKMESISTSAKCGGTSSTY